MPRPKKWVIDPNDELWRQNNENDNMLFNTMFKDYIHENETMQKMIKSYIQFIHLFQYFDIYTTRFKNDTFIQNQRMKHNVFEYNDSCKQHGSLYSTMLPFPKNTSDHKYLFILDMNNETNTIMGIGFLKNILSRNQDLNIYDDPSFNNYIYKSMFYIPICDLNQNYCENIEPSWIEFIKKEFIQCLFYGKSNLKRGGSFSRFPMKKLKYIHLKFLLSLFIIINPNHFNDIIKVNN